MAEHPAGFGTDLAPTCDRCGTVPQGGAVMDMDTLANVCFECLTPDERQRFASGKPPFERGEA